MALAQTLHILAQTIEKKPPRVFPNGAFPAGTIPGMGAERPEERRDRVV